jgi:3-methyl-2-oxobutanoate hydroxymethyltransferase
MNAQGMPDLEEYRADDAELKGAVRLRPLFMHPRAEPDAIVHGPETGFRAVRRRSRRKRAASWHETPQAVMLGGDAYIQPSLQKRRLYFMSTHVTDVADVDQLRRVTTQSLQEMKTAGVPIAMLTAYDYTSARILDGAGVDILLVGDSASNVMAGHETTLPITLDQMIYHAQCVLRGVKRALVVVDLPFGTYQGNSKEALVSAIRVMKESGAHAIKLEGGEPVVPAIERILMAGIPVMGHLGLTPQSIYKFGTYKVRARDEQEAEQLEKDARLLEQTGCFGIVLEKIPAALAQKVTHSIQIPTIGIGAGVDCDGQVLVTHDALGLTTDFHPRFVRRYAELARSMTEAVETYIRDVRTRSFPTADESY